MGRWLKKYWIVLLLIAFLIAIVDVTLSSLLTCHPVSNEANQSVSAQKPQECTAFMGPVLLSLEWLVDFFDEHGEAVVAAFTAVLAVFTGRLWISTEKLWKSANETAELARKEFISTHRPQIRIRRIFPITPFAANAAPQIRILAANIGTTDATVFEIGWDIYTDMDAIPEATPTPNPAPWKIPPGKQASIDIVAPNPLTGEQAAYAREGWIFIVGIINYWDDQGAVRATSFARQFSTRRNRFIPVDDLHRESDREYEN